MSAAAIVPLLGVLSVTFVADDFIALATYQQADAHVSAWRFLLDAVLTNARVPTLFYRPVAFFSVWMETRIWGTWALPFHLTNLLLHAAVCLLAFALMRRANGTARTRIAIASAPSARVPVASAIAIVSFALFPRRVETVAWIACRPDLLAACFGVAAALVFTRGGWTASWLSATLWFVSLLSKESALLLPLAFAALPRAREDDDVKSHVRRALPFGLAFVAYLTLRRTALGMWIGGYGASQMTPSPMSFVRAARHVAYLLLPPIEGADDALWLERTAAGAILVLLALLVWRAFAARREPIVRFGAAWIVATVVPIAALPVSLATTFNDRLLYLPGIGMACLLAGLLASLPARALLASAIPIALLFGADTVRLTHHWQMASAMSDRLIATIASDIRSTSSDGERTLYLAAVPDSYRGAYVLRSSIDFALRVAGVDRVPRLVILGRYFVDREDDEPVGASREDGRTVIVSSCTSGAALLPDPSSLPFASLQVLHDGQRVDRYGRFMRRQVTVAETDRVLIVTPRGIHPVLGGDAPIPCPPPIAAR